MATILMIDDDPDYTLAIKVLIEAHGHRFFSASSGEAGLHRVKEVNPDLIILDLMMERYDEGFLVSQQLRDLAEESPYAAYRGVPIVVLTSIHRTTPHRFAPDPKSLPVDALLEKSTPPERVLATINTLLAGVGR